MHDPLLMYDGQLLDLMNTKTLTYAKSPMFCNPHSTVLCLLNSKHPCLNLPSPLNSLPFLIPSIPPAQDPDLPHSLKTSPVFEVHQSLSLLPQLRLPNLLLLLRHLKVEQQQRRGHSTPRVSRSRSLPSHLSYLPPLLNIISVQGQVRVV